jgi:hypothetical protein
MAQTRKIEVTGIKKREISTEDLANIFYLRTKRRLRERRQNDVRVKERVKRRERRRGE